MTVIQTVAGGAGGESLIEVTSNPVTVTMSSFSLTSGYTYVFLTNYTNPPDTLKHTEIAGGVKFALRPSSGYIQVRTSTTSTSGLNLNNASDKTKLINALNSDTMGLNKLKNGDYYITLEGLTYTNMASNTSPRFAIPMIRIRATDGVITIPNPTSNMGIYYNGNNYVTLSGIVEINPQ